MLSAWALGPHELVVIANGASSNSVQLARQYCVQRSVPEANLVTIKLPEALTRSRDMSPDQFRLLIRDPVQSAIGERNLAHVLAWAYSVDFPVRVTTTPATSLTGYTFVSGRLPAPRLVDDGRYASPLFAGPSRVNGISHYSQSFDALRDWLGGEMPVPAMVLGVGGERGNTMAEIEACLAAGLSADGSMPTGTVFFALSDDVRSRCRRWQFGPTASELAEMGVSARVVDGLPPGGLEVLGILAGSPVVTPRAAGPYLPGAMCEHLTSLAAVFETPNQTKLTAWIAAGATASCGTVTEPRSIWTKFPHARFFVHYRAGCTMIESFYQAVRCPLQLLIAGDPLAAPWGPTGVRIELHGVPLRPAVGAVRLSGTVGGEGAMDYRRFMFLVDGSVVGREPVLWLDASKLAPGPHSIRCVAYKTGLLRRQVFAEAVLSVAGEE